MNHIQLFLALELFYSISPEIDKKKRSLISFVKKLELSGKDFISTNECETGPILLKRVLNFKMCHIELVIYSDVLYHFPW